MTYRPRRAFWLVLVISAFFCASVWGQALQEPGCSRCDDPLLTGPSRAFDGCFAGDGDVSNPMDALVRQESGYGAVPGSDHCGGPLASDSSVYLFSGEFFHNSVDLRVPGRGFDFVWGRKYRSRIGGNALIGEGWDYSYNIGLTEITARPSEAIGLIFPTKNDMQWSPPLFAAGNPLDLRYCTFRSLNPADFFTAPTILDPEQPDTMTNDPAVPLPGQVFFYTIAPKSGSRQGPIGFDSAGVERPAAACGLTGVDLVLHDGHARNDLYTLSAPGLWNAPEFFRDLSAIPGGFQLVFPDSGVWNFNEFAGNPDDGKIRSIVDRNGNTMQFTYDASGRLDTIIDTLNRPYSITYNADGFLEKVGDFAGRSVTYDYYPLFSPDGSFGDLRSVTTPSVIGTPTGNDFPLGKTTVYTYSVGFADNRLNHNLLTITDPKGQLFLENIYSPNLNPADIDFDTVATQLWGGPGDVVDYFYQGVAPNFANNFAVVRAIENDRMGNVSEYFYDDRNRNVMVQDFTGRAPNPAGQTTDLLNRPVGPLRPTDPLFFETRYSYDPLESVVVRATHPNLNETAYVYDLAAPFRRSQGNLREKCVLPGPLGGAQPQICEEWEYDIGGGGTTGSNFVTRHVDGRGNDTFHFYDPAGNRMQTQHRIPAIVENFTYNPLGQLETHVLPDNGSGVLRKDLFSYYGAGPQLGYLAEIIVDDGGLGLTTTYDYDPLGRRILEIDPKGNDTIYEFNELDQIVREISREVVPGAGPRYEIDTFYDANDNVVRRDVLNLDDAGILQPNTHFTTVYEYDILNNLVRTCQESGSYVAGIPGPVDQPTCVGLPFADFVRTEYVYDANRNREFVFYGESTNGAQPDNEVRHIYDERDLLFQRSLASGGPDRATDQYDYDGNANVAVKLTGLETGAPHESLFTYDGYDRVILVVDPMRNEQSYDYDENDNVVHRQVDGELDDQPGSAGNIRLGEWSYTYDFMDRLVREEQLFFDTATQLPLGPGSGLFTWDFSDNSQLIRYTDAAGNPTDLFYDSANRKSLVVDALGNQVQYDYDANDNVVQEIVTEKSDAGNPDEIFVTTNEYDGLDRLVREFDSVGNVRDFAYDSRGNLTTTQDAQRPTAADPGNVTLHVYDGLDRLVETTRILTNTGFGTGLVIGAITNSSEWDASSRMVAQTDDAGNKTTYTYDALNRVTQIDYADGTAELYGYDAHHNRVSSLDAVGNSVTYGYDGLDRNVSRNVVPAAGVGGTTFEAYTYDGLSRLTSAEDDDSLVERLYDSLSNVVSESINGLNTDFAYDEQSNKRQITYPGGRVIELDYDPLNREKVINDPGLGPIGVYEYIGPARVEARNYGNGTATIYTYDGVVNPPGDFGVKRIVGTLHENPGAGAVIDEHVYRYDRMYNKTLREDVFAGSVIDQYDYDSIYRMRQSSRLLFGGGPNVIQYNLDGVGNRINVIGGPDPGGYLMDPTFPNPADQQNNQYTFTSWQQRIYDDNGNLRVQDPGGGTQRNSTYDYRNQMIEHQDTAAGVASTYAYDAIGRRIARQTTAGVDELYFYDGLRIIEEQDSAATVLATYVWGRHLDEILNMDRGGNIFFYHGDDQFSTTSLTDGGGNVVERYLYDDYGAPQFFDPGFVAIGGSAVRNPYLFTGRRFDDETGWYHYRTRYLDPRAGRFTTRDTVGPWCDTQSLGNGYTYVSSNPASWIDPLGMGAFFDNPLPPPAPKAQDEWIEILSVGPAVGGAGSSTAGGSKPPSVNIQDVTLSLWLDSSTPKLQLSCAPQTSLLPITYCARNLDYYDPAKYMVWTYQVEGTTKDSPTEAVTLDYQKIEWSYKKHDPTGGRKGERQPEYRWDLRGGDQGLDPNVTNERPTAQPNPIPRPATPAQVPR